MMTMLSGTFSSAAAAARPRLALPRNFKGLRRALHWGLGEGASHRPSLIPFLGFGEDPLGDAQKFSLLSPLLLLLSPSHHHFLPGNVQ